MNTEQTNLLFPHLFNQHKIHSFLLEDKPAFIAYEVGAALGIKNPRSSIMRNKALQEGEDYASCTPKDIGMEGVDGTESRTVLHSTLPNRLIVLFESGLYTFVLRSDKLAAIAFQQWVVEEVLPTIRKQGFYGALESELHSKMQPQHPLKMIEMAGKGNGYAKRLLHERGVQPLTEDAP